MQLYFLGRDTLGRSLKVTDVCLYEKSRSRCQRPTRRGLTETPARRFEGTMKKQQLRPNNTWQTCQRHKSRKLARRAKVNTGDVSPSELLTRPHCFWAHVALRKRRSSRCARFFPNCTDIMAKITAASRAPGRGSWFPTEWTRSSPPGCC